MGLLVHHKGQHRFGKHQRLLTPKSFKDVFAKGERYHHPLFLVMTSTSVTVADDGEKAALSPARLGLAVSKKVSRLAVVRNRIKRYIREAFRHEQDQFQGFDVVVVARKPAVEATGEDIRSALSRIAKRVGQTKHR